jgi:CAAX protease family protein
MTSAGMEVEAPPPAPPRSPWTWTDIVLSIPLAVVLALAIVLAVLAPVSPLLRQLDTGLRTAVTSLISQAALYAGAVAAVAGLIHLRRHASLRLLGWAPVSARWLLSALPLALAAYMLVILAGAVGHVLLPHAQNSQPTLVRGAFGHQLLIAVVAVSVVAPFAEETYFRGFLFGWLRGRVPFWLAVVISSLLFAAAHGEPALLLPTFALGCLLAVVYQRSGSLYPGMLVHAVFNLVGVTLILTTSPPR